MLKENKDDKTLLHIPNVEQFAGSDQSQIQTKTDTTGNFKEKFIIPISKGRDELVPMHLAFNANDLDGDFLGNIDIDLLPCFQNMGHFMYNGYFN